MTGPLAKRKYGGCCAQGAFDRLSASTKKEKHVCLYVRQMFGGSLVQAACKSSQSTHQRFMIHRKVGNEVIQAHSIILAARSPVFERMFSCKGLRSSASAEALTAERDQTEVSFVVGTSGDEESRTCTILSEAS